MSDRPDLREQALRLRSEGYGYVRIGRELAIPPTSVRRLVKPGYADHLRRLSREAKRRRSGTCSVCGGPTRYHGHRPGGVSSLCASCGATAGGDLRREATLGQGPTQARILAFVGHDERGFMEIVAGAGVTKASASSLLHRLVKYGLLERPRRGVYRVPVQ